MAKKIILFGLLLIALMVSGCVWYGGHGHGDGYYRHDYSGYYNHDRHGWDRHHHGDGHRDWR